MFYRRDSIFRKKIVSRTEIKVRFVLKAGFINLLRQIRNIFTNLLVVKEMFVKAF